MNYEKIILNLLNDVADLKERVTAIESNSGSNNLFSDKVRTFNPKDLKFVDYLITVRGMKESTALSRNSNCKRVERYEDSLKEHYQKDRCKQLLRRLEYSMDDQVHGRPASHNIPIEGNVFNGTATLKQAVNLYIEYLEYIGG